MQAEYSKWNQSIIVRRISSQAIRDGGFWTKKKEKICSKTTLTIWRGETENPRKHNALIKFLRYVDFSQKAKKSR